MYAFIITYYYFNNNVLLHMLLLKIRTLDNAIREFSLAWPWAMSHYKITEILCTH